uniref:Uncharacterized protein n=1 Tax=Oryza rufipogon TaxID=4529 RepID=A0A0E0Q1J9_ORYRU
MALHLQSIGPLARFRLSTHTYQGQPGLFEYVISDPRFVFYETERVHRHRRHGPSRPAISHCSSSWSPATMTAFARLPPKVASNTNAELSSPPKLLKCVEVYPPDPVL